MIRAVLALALALAGCAANAPRPRPPKVVQLNVTGEPVDLAAALVPGHVTVIDFWAAWCAGCKVVDERMLAVVGDIDGVVIRKIDIGDGETAVARQHKVGALPHIRIFDRSGNLRYVLAGNDALEAGERARELSQE